MSRVANSQELNRLGSMNPDDFAKFAERNPSMARQVLEHKFSLMSVQSVLKNATKQISENARRLQDVYKGEKK